MGFGLCVLGYLLTVFDTFYAGVLGWPLLAAGFFKLAKVRGSFMYAALMSVLCTAYSVADVMVLLKLLDGNGRFYLAIHVAYIVLGACIHLVYLLSIRSMAIEGGDMNIAVRALIWLAFTELYYVCSAVSAVTLFGAEEISYASQVLGNVIIIMKYAVGFTNLWFLYGCYAKITTVSQMEKDEAALRKIEEQERKKREKRNKEQK